MKTSHLSENIQLVRYGDLEPCYDAFIDTRTPGSEQKENFTIIGPGVSENPNQHVHIAQAHGFNIGGARQPPGCVNSQHSHDTAEFFYVHTGIWSFDLGEDGKDASVELKPGDAISIPTQLFRGFENVGEDTGFLWAVLGGDDPGRVLWAPPVFDMAKDYGLVLLENGSLIDTTKGEAIPEGGQTMPKTTPEQVKALQVFDSAALRDCCVASDEAAAEETGDGWQKRNIVGPSGKLNWPHEFAVEEVRLEVGGVFDLGAVSHPQVLFTHHGSVLIRADEETKIMRNGDTATIGCGINRNIENDGDDVAIIVIVTGTAP